MVLNAGQNQDNAECGVASISSGKKTSWFRKMKNDSAKAKWLSDSNWRFFTVDFDKSTIYYSNSETTLKNVSCPIAFRDIVEVKLLDRKLQRGLTGRLFGGGDDNCIGFSLITFDREMRLLCKTLDDAKKWVSIFGAAQKLGQRSPLLVKSPSRASMSTEPGSDEGPPQLSDTDSGETPGFKQDQGLNPERGYKPFVPDRHTLPMQDLPPWATPTPEPGSKPLSFFEPDAVDAFAALEALQEELGPVPTTPEAPKVDAATAIKAAKVRRSQKAKGSKVAKDGQAAAEPFEAATDKPVVRNLAKEMSDQDRNARDMALLQKVQMPHRSSKALAEEAPPLKATRPLKRASAWDEEPVMAKFTSFTENGWVTETHQLSGGRDEKISKDDDTNSWDGDAEEIQPAKGISSCVAGDDQNSWDGSGDERAAEALAKTSKVSRSSKAAETLAKASKGSKSSKASKVSKDMISVPAPTKDDDPWDSDDDCKTKAPPVPKSFCGPSEGKVDQTSWDDDDEDDLVMTRKTRKKGKSSKSKQEVDEDDPTAGLDDLLDGKEVSIPVHQYVDGFQCTQCDFKVIRFQGFEWGPKAEYLFFRNYYGKPQKLKSRLVAKSGCSAYCCQCAFKSVPSDLALTDVKDNTRWKVVSS